MASMGPEVTTTSTQDKRQEDLPSRGRKWLCTCSVVPEPSDSAGGNSWRHSFLAIQQPASWAAGPWRINHRLAQFSPPSSLSLCACVCMCGVCMCTSVCGNFFFFSFSHFQGFPPLSSVLAFIYLFFSFMSSSSLSLSNISFFRNTSRSFPLIPVSSLLFGWFFFQLSVFLISSCLCPISFFFFFSHYLVSECLSSVALLILVVDLNSLTIGLFVKF